MATQNVCRYFKFGHCKFNDRCRLLHIKEECENPYCDIRLCNLRHPKTCKFFNEYNRCKFSDYCSYKHKVNINKMSPVEMKEILEKLESMNKTIQDKDKVINELVEKVKILEEKIFGRDNEPKNCLEETEMDSTFFNPSVGFNCEKCDFIAKSKGGLKVHVKAKHTEIKEMKDQSSEILNLENNDLCENEIENPLKCNECEYVAQTNEDLNTHMASAHEQELETEIKLEVFTIVDFGRDVFDARNMIIEKLSEQDGVEKVLKVYVNKNEVFMDVDNVVWNSADIFLKTKKKADLWKRKTFINNIFSKCYLWETIRTVEGENSREDIEKGIIERRREEVRQRRYMGYY